MQLKQEQLDSFKLLYKEKFNIELNDREALEYWLKLLNFMKVILLFNKKKDEF